MAVLTYKSGKYYNLAGNQIYDGTNWNPLKGDSKIFLNGKWHDFGWETHTPSDEDFVFPDYPGFDFDIGEEPEGVEIAYVTPTGTGLMDGSSWDNAYAGINTALQYGAEYIYCKEGVYEEPILYASASGRIVIGGFSDEGTWDSRDTIKHPTIINCSGDTSAFRIQFRGCIGNWNRLNIVGCVALNAGRRYDNLNSQDTIVNSVCVNCDIDSGNNKTGWCNNSTIINSNINGYASSASDSIASENVVFINSNITCPGGKIDGAAYTLSNLANVLAVNCNFNIGVYNYLFSSAWYVTLVNSSIQGDWSFASYAIHNYIRFSSEQGVAGTAGNRVIADIYLGTDNSLAKFYNTGYFPAIGTVDVGECPSPIDDPAGFTQYVNSFGDWRPMQNSVLAGRGDSHAEVTTDLDGVLRPNLPALGCYEPIPMETEQ